MILIARSRSRLQSPPQNDLNILLSQKPTNLLHLRLTTNFLHHSILVILEIPGQKDNLQAALMQPSSTTIPALAFAWHRPRSNWHLPLLKKRAPTSPSSRNEHQPPPLQETSTNLLLLKKPPIRAVTSSSSRNDNHLTAQNR